jgi:hypothetical protein
MDITAKMRFGATALHGTLMMINQSQYIEKKEKK